MTLEALIPVIRQKLTAAAGFRARVKFECGADGTLFVDATQTPPHVAHGAEAEAAEADTTFSCTYDTLVALMEGRQDPNLAFMTGKLKIRGSMGIALKLSSLLED